MDSREIKRNILLELEEEISYKLPFPMISSENTLIAWKLAFTDVKKEQCMQIEQIWTYVEKKTELDKNLLRLTLLRRGNANEIKDIVTLMKNNLDKYTAETKTFTQEEYRFEEFLDAEHEIDHTKEELSLFLRRKLPHLTFVFEDYDTLVLELIEFLIDTGCYFGKEAHRLIKYCEETAEYYRKTSHTDKILTKDVHSEKLELRAAEKAKKTESSTSRLQILLSGLQLSSGRIDEYLHRFNENKFCLFKRKELSIKKRKARKLHHEPVYFHTRMTHFPATILDPGSTSSGYESNLDELRCDVSSHSDDTLDVLAERTLDEEQIIFKHSSNAELGDAKSASNDMTSTSDRITDAQHPSIDDIFQKVQKVRGFQGIYQVDGENGKPFIVLDTYNDKDHSVENFLKTEYRDWWGKDLFVVVEQDHAIRHLVHSGSGIYHKSEGSIACLASDDLNLEKMYAITAQHNFKCQQGIHNETEIMVSYGQETDMKILGNTVKGAYGTFNGSFVDIAAVELSKECLETLDKQKLLHLTECYNGDQADLKGVRVAKVGVNTGMTRGVIIQTHFHAISTTEDGKEHECRNLIMIASAQEENFASAGDSGSLVYRENSGQPIGIVTLHHKRNTVNARKQIKQIHAVLAFKLKNGIDALATWCDMNVKACQQYENVIPVIASPNTYQFDYDGQRNPEENNESDKSDSQTLFDIASSIIDQSEYDGQRNPEENNSTIVHDLPALFSIVHERKRRNVNKNDVKKNRRLCIIC